MFFMDKEKKKKRTLIYFFFVTNKTSYFQMWHFQLCQTLKNYETLIWHNNGNIGFKVAHLKYKI